MGQFVYQAAFRIVIGVAALLVAGDHDAWAQNRDPVVAVNRYDQDQDGRVSLDEWTRPPKIFKRIDENDDGYLTADEFSKFWEARAANGAGKLQSGQNQPAAHVGQQSEPSADDVIARMDRDGDGNISREEWPRSERIFKLKDADGNGMISRDELSNASTNVDSTKANLLRIWQDDMGIFATSAIVLAYQGDILAQEGTGVSATTPMSVASVSKPFAGACAYQAMQQGLITEETTLADGLASGLEADGLIDPARAGITVGGLLSQTAGIGPDQTQSDYYKRFVGTSASQDAYIARVALNAPPYRPGDYYYTKENFSIFAKLLEALSGQSYEQFCQQAVFLPINVNSAQLSDYWGFYGAGGGWQISTLDLAKFAIRYANPQQGLGAELTRFASGAVSGRVKYGMGMFYRESVQGVSIIYHSGFLAVWGGGRQDSAFFISTRNGWTIAVTARGRTSDDMRELQNALFEETVRATP